jgi:hypothetical protein
VVDVLFPSTVGLVVRALLDGYASSSRDYASGVAVQPELPEVKSARMVTVRDDSGADDSTQTRRRKGVNVWAEDAITAENLALLSMAILRKAADGKPITATRSFAGPYKVYDDPAYSVDGRSLAHYYFAFELSARGVNF